MKNVPCWVDVLNGFAGSSEDLAADVLSFANLFFFSLLPRPPWEAETSGDFMFKGLKQSWKRKTEVVEDGRKENDNEVSAGEL